VNLPAVSMLAKRKTSANGSPTTMPTTRNL